MSFTIGCDPELFLKNQSGKFISSIGLIGGSKHLPLPISNEGHAILEDNVAVEFNIPPAQSCDDFVKHIKFTMEHLEEKAKSLQLNFAVNVASAEFDADQLDNPMALEFGCDPDFNAWTQDMNPRPHAASQSLRSCGGHIHVGSKADPIQLIRAMDLFVGVPSILKDMDTRRRELYGKAGCFRFKPYGAEYRTLSNFWIWDVELTKWVYAQTEKAVVFAEAGNIISDNEGILIQQCINHGDIDAYDQLAQTYRGI